MITRADIQHWRNQVPWIAADNVEQDLVLSRLIVEIANHSLLSKELVFRGGTCFHKIWLDRPWRYSEDLDYVRRTDGGVGEILDALKEVADLVGFERTRTDVRQHPKVRLHSTFMTGEPMRIKIEMNTYERSPVRPIVSRPFAVNSPWFTGTAEIATFAIEELVATKIRALYQRRKGRDLFDLWLAITHAGAQPRDIANCFGPYRPEKWNPSLALQNLSAKLDDTRFIEDLDALVPRWPEEYDIEVAAEAARSVIAHIPN